MKIEDVIQEALPISTAKTYVAAWDPNFHKQVFEREPRKDRNAYRIYLPFETEPRKEVKIPDELTSYLQTAIPNKPYTTDADNYMQGLAFEVANPTRKLGIGKMLARSEGQEKDAARKAQLQALKRAFDADPQRAATKKADKLIAISRHPYDVAGMSTDRGWRSCMNLVDGINRHYVLRDVKQGSIIAYLINADDLNIQKPLARILIKPYQEKGNPTNMAMMGDAVYGTAPPEFKQQVDAWVNTRYNADKTGLFCLAKGLYRDVIPQQMRLMSDAQYAQAPQAQIVRMGEDDDREWPRIAKLRSDADDILLQIAINKDSRAAKLIKQIDVPVMLKAIKKRPQILARLHTQPDELVSAALAQDASNVRYVRNRTPDQHAQVLKLIKQDPDIIRVVHAPTPEQIQKAFKLDNDLLDWIKEKHPYILNSNQVLQWLRDAIHHGDEVTASDIAWIKTSHPEVWQNPKVFELIAENEPELIWDQGRVSDVDLIKLIDLSPKPDPYDWDTNWLQEHVPELIARLKRMSPSEINADFKLMIMKKIPDLLGAFDDLDVKALVPLVKKKPFMIAHWHNPDPQLVYVALLNDHDLDDRFQADKYDPVWLTLIKKDPDWITRHKTPSAQLQKAAALHPKLSRHVAWYLVGDSRTDVRNQVRLLKRYPDLIRLITKPSLAAQMAAVHADPDVYDLIKPKDRAPAVKAYVAAYKNEMRKPE